MVAGSRRAFERQPQNQRVLLRIAVVRGSLAHRALFAVGATLFLMTLVMNLTSYKLAARLRRRGGR